MKNLYKILPIAIVLILFGALLYILELPPFVSAEPEPPQIKLAQKKPETFQPPKTQLTEIPTKSSQEIYAESMKQGAALAAKSYYSLAINEYRKASSAMPGSIEPLNEIGKIYLNQRNSEKAIQAFEEIIGMGSNDDGVKINLARAHLQNANIQKAKGIFSGLSQQNQISAYYKAIIAACEGNYEESKKLFSEASGGDNEWIKARSQTFLAAYSEFSKFEGGQPTHIKTLIGKALNQTGEYSLAIPILANVIKEKSNYRDAWTLLGYAYLNNSKPAEAIEALEQARKLDPSKSETLFFLGLAYFAENKIDNAINYIESSLEKGFEPRVQAYQKLAELYFVKQDYAKSAKAYETVLGINSTNVDYFIRPIWIYIEKLHNPSAALDLAQTSLISHPNSAMAYNLIGWAYAAAGNYDLGKKNLETAIKIDPNLAAAHLNLGQMYEKMNYTKTAKEYYKKAFELDKNTSSIGALAAERYNKIAQIETQEAQKKTQKIPAGKVYQVNTFGQ